MLTPQQLRVLVAIRERGSLTAAAAQLGYGTPTIAHHLDVLERWCETPLVERRRGGSRLTAIGEVLAAEAVHILDRIDRAERRVRAARGAGMSTLRIGTFASAGSQLLPRAIRMLRERHEVQIELVADEPTEVLRLLRMGDLDGGLIYDSSFDPAFTDHDLDLTTLRVEPHLVMLAATHPLAERNEIDLAELHDLHWIFSRSGTETTDRVLQRVCRRLGYEPHIAMRTDDLQMLHGLVAAELGVALATESMIDRRFSVIARPAVQELGSRTTLFVRNADDRISLLDALQELLAGLA